MARATLLTGYRDVTRKQFSIHPAVQVSGIAMAGTAKDCTGVVHGGRCPDRADRVATATGVTGIHRCRRPRMRCGTTGSPGATGMATRHSAVGCNGDWGGGRSMIECTGRQPGRCRMARGAWRSCRDMASLGRRPVVAGVGMATAAGGQASMVHRRCHSPTGIRRMASAAGGAG
jgi:hypothetical protein